MASVLHVSAGVIPEDKQTSLDALESKFDDANAELIRHAAKIHEPLFAERATITKSIKGFWHQALVNCLGTSIYIDDDDHALLAHITDIKVHRDLSDPRAATIEFFFSPNDFISDASLKKEYKLAEDANPLGDKFVFHEDTVPQKTAVSWKSEDKNLAKLKPTKGPEVTNGADGHDDDADDDDFEPGSFFSSLFENTSKAVAGILGENIVDELFQNAVAFYLNTAPEAFFGGDDDDDDEDDDDEDDAAEIDLEADEPAKKKTKKE
ncbi:hypothetical protein CF327_g5092 [Tilletia walkeri]|uniref:Protein SET n=1 Tax=Tilletia walkeri TaxID=117179 RepID=A0A8X7N768_9BASI|nr:hypothetical protein CF327_g5092 [Tilletia walkeri]KAE8267874.1 hypothetical protein A4X09_0g4470 [Tilletia walkeri]